MIKEQEKTLTRDTDFIEDAEAQVREWLDDFEDLEDEIKRAGADIEQAVKEQIADLKSELDDVEARFNELRSSDPDHWEERKYNFQRASWVYQQSYGVAVRNIMRMPETRPAGWLEGFTNRPPIGSAGWLEGFDAEATGSEGWVEGMAKKGPKSEGWTEGFHDDK